MKTGKFKLIIMAVFLLLTFPAMNIALAQESAGGDDTETTQEDAQEPAFSNPAQAQRAINLAEAYAAKPDPELENALDEVEKAQQAYDAAKAAEDLDALADLQEALDAANTKADELAANCADVTPEDIAGMRADGLGWGEIAHELGLHPGLLGIRHTNQYRNKKGWGDDISTDDEISDTEIAEATTRNFKSGFSRGHGASVDNQGKGKSAGKSNSNSGNSNSGKSNSGKSNSGNNGGGRGNSGGGKDK